MTQAALNFAAGPISAIADANQLGHELELIGRWVTRVELQGRYPFGEWPERRFRSAAAASKGSILGGSRGYCLTTLANLEDARHVRNALASQVRHMTQRIAEIDRVLHGR